MREQTNYDKNIEVAWKEYQKGRGIHIYSLPSEEFKTAFKQGYRFGVWQQMEKQKAEQTDHERDLIALGDDYMVAMKNAEEKGYKAWTEEWSIPKSEYDVYGAYRQGWNDSDAFDEEWTKQHPETLLNCLLADHPEIIENEVKARMKDIRKEAKENEGAFAFGHFRDSTEMMRYEIAMRAMQQLMPLGVEEYHQPDKVAELAVTYANALIRELGN